MFKCRDVYLYTHYYNNITCLQFISSPNFWKFHNPTGAPRGCSCVPLAPQPFFIEAAQKRNTTTE